MSLCRCIFQTSRKINHCKQFSSNVPTYYIIQIICIHSHQSYAISLNNIKICIFLEIVYLSKIKVFKIIKIVATTFKLKIKYGQHDNKNNTQVYSLLAGLRILSLNIFYNIIIIKNIFLTFNIYNIYLSTICDSVGAFKSFFAAGTTRRIR